jgi:hypothetical protein
MPDRFGLTGTAANYEKTSFLFNFSYSNSSPVSRSPLLLGLPIIQLQFPLSQTSFYYLRQAPHLAPMPFLKRNKKTLLLRALQQSYQSFSLIQTALSSCLLIDKG